MSIIVAFESEPAPTTPELTPAPPPGPVRRLALHASQQLAVACVPLVLHATQPVYPSSLARPRPGAHQQQFLAAPTDPPAPAVPTETSVWHPDALARRAFAAGEQQASTLAPFFLHATQPVYPHTLARRRPAAQPQAATAAPFIEAPTPLAAAFFPDRFAQPRGASQWMVTYYPEPIAAPEPEPPSIFVAPVNRVSDPLRRRGRSRQ